MKKIFFSLLFYWLVFPITGNSQILTARPANNPVLNGPLIDAKEVGDGAIDYSKASNRGQMQGTNGTNDFSNPAFINSNFSLNGYLISIIKPNVRINKLASPTIGKIKIIDVRTDPGKVGFKPVDYTDKRNGIISIALQVQGGLRNWLQENVLEQCIQTDSTSKRQLVIMINKCWLTNDAESPYTGRHSTLTQSLQYDIAIYSSLGYGYFPIKQLIGSFSKSYQSNDKEFPLFDSLTQLICKEVNKFNFTDAEKEENLVSINDFNIFYNSQKNMLRNIASPKRGVYRSYEDFLLQKVSSDSIEIIKKYDNVGRYVLYAVEVTQIIANVPTSTNACWGFSDGRSLFVNVGNGFFVRLVRAEGNYVFYGLNAMREDRIKSTTRNGITFGNSTFDIIKDYARVMPLTYQLDPLTGKLY
jgi:hypothetical protein